MRKAFVLVLFSSIACAQIPKPTLTQTLNMADYSLRSLDALTTYQALNNPCNCVHEMDPIAPHTKSMAPIVLFQAGVSAALTVAEKRLDHHNHHKIARIIIIADIVSESVALDMNYHSIHYRPTASPVPIKTFK